MSLDPRRGLAEQIYLRLRDAILAGRMAAGARLPSTRAMSAELGVSRNTVLGAYDQLLAEGYLVMRRGSGTFVASPLPSERPLRAQRRLPPADYPSTRFAERAREAGRHFAAIGRLRPVRYDFVYGRPDPRLAPLSLLGRAVVRVLRRPALSYGHAAGSPALRAQLAAHLERSRGVSVAPRQIVIVSGTQQALGLCARCLLEPGDPVLIEDPHYLAAREVLRAHDARLVGAPVDAEGLVLERRPRARLAYVTPSHQFPTGAVMSAPRRLALLEWAEAAGAVIFEDDYDSEFRFAGRAIQALAGLDALRRVIYCGTFSKTLFPSLRLGYLALPEPLVARFAAAKWLADWGSPWLEQEVVARLMEDGDYDRHVRRMRAACAARREALLTAVAAELGDAVEVSGGDAGLHVVLWLPARASEAAICAAARELDVGVYPVSPQYLGVARPGLLLGYGSLDEKEITQGIRRLARAFA